MISRSMRQATTVLDGGRIVDLKSGELSDPVRITVMGGNIVEIGPTRGTPEPQALLLHGLTIIPGLVDCHVHLIACTADLGLVTDLSPAYVTAWAARQLGAMLMRGFTTVRDAGGAEAGLAMAVEEGLFAGPRVVFGGPALTQTGGHGDYTRPSGRTPRGSYPSIGRVCDGDAEVRRAVREALRGGARHVKLMLSGGIASPHDQLDSVQFSLAEIRAAVDEADAAGKYIAGHAYSARAINRALIAGVRSIEHGNWLDDQSISLLLEHQAFLVPTLVTYRVLSEQGVQWGLSERSAAKIGDAFSSGLEALDRASRAGAAIAFGTDLLGGMQATQSQEFMLRAEVQPPLAILNSATTTAARLLRMEGEIGQVREGFRADLVAVRGNPALDASLLAAPERNVALVMSRGRVVRSEL